MATTLPDPPTPPRFGRRPTLPTGRSVVGGLLVVAAALGTVAAAGGDDAPPRPLRIVAARDIAPGERLRGEDVRVAPAALDGHDHLLFDAPSQVEGAVAVAPLAAGDLVQASAVLPADEAGDGASQLTFRVETARALGGRLVPGERVDVIATFGTGADAVTRRVAAGAIVVRVDAVEAVTTSGELAITLAVEDPTVVLPLVHATTAAAITLVRSDGALPDGDEVATSPDRDTLDERTEPTSGASP